MKPFTYREYMYYKIMLERKNYGKNLIKEPETNYEYEDNNINNPHDKIFKEILDNKTEAVKFINEMLKIENTKNALQEKDIEKYKRRFTTEDFHNMESDIIYKKTNQNVFFLIEHQSTIDYSMPYRMLKYNMAIMESAIDTEKVMQKNYKLPIIFSFVIYTGNKKWNASNYLWKKQEQLLGCKGQAFGNFQVVDINDYTKEQLLKSENLLSKMMLLEKAKDYEELERYVQEIINSKIDYQQKNFLKRVINYILKSKIHIKKINEFNEKLQVNKKEGESIMFVEIVSRKIDEILEMFDKIQQEKSTIEQERSTIEQEKEKIKEKNTEIQKIKKEMQKREKAINNAEDEMILKMLENNIDEKNILKIIKVDKNRLEKIKQKASKE